MRAFLAALERAFSSSILACSRRDLKTPMAFSRFLICDFSSWQLTTTPVGMCVMRTAESVVLTLWPPLPPERNTSTRRSERLMTRSVSTASGNTATVTVEV